MSTIAENLKKLQNAKSSLKSSIENKGVSVPTDASISTYSTYVDTIVTGKTTEMQSLSVTSNGSYTNVDKPYSSVTVNVETGESYTLSSITITSDTEWVSSDSTVMTAITADYSSYYQKHTDASGNTYIINEDGDKIVTYTGSTPSVGDYEVLLTFADGTTQTDTYEDGIIPANQYSGNTAITSVEIGDMITEIGDRAFCNCSSLTSVTIPNSVTTIGIAAFYVCSSLTSITIPNSVTSIGIAAFYICSSLTSVTIGNNVTSIGGSAFWNCSSLTSVIIGDGVTTIGEWAFKYCSSLTSVTCNASSEPTISSSTFRNIATGGTLYTPNSSDDWSTWMSTDYYYLGYRGWTQVK